jgi:hypothetical protein
MQIDFNEQLKKHESSIRVNRDSFSNMIDSIFELAKHDFGRISTFRGMQIDFNEQFEKHESSIRLSCDSLSNVIDSSGFGFQFVSPAKHDFARISTFRGIQIDFNEQFEKHESSIRFSRDSFSNVIDSTFESAKHDFARSSTFRGIQIDFNEQLKKHDSSIRVNRDSLSNVIDSTFEPTKHDLPIISTEL